MFKTRLIFLSLLLLCFTFFSCVGDETNDDSNKTTGGETITLTFASDAPHNHFADLINHELAKDIEEKTNGRIDVKYYDNAKLGGYDKVYSKIVDGSVDIGQFSIPGNKSLYGLAYTPYFALNYDQVKKLYQEASYIYKLAKKLHKKDDVTFLGFLFEGFIGLGSKVKVNNHTSPSADKGILARTAGIEVFNETIKNLGYKTKVIPYNEIIVALETDQIDAWFGGTSNMNYIWAKDHISYFYHNFQYAEITSYVMSDKTIAKLSDEDKEIITKAIKKASVKSFSNAEENDNKYLKKLESEGGVKVIKFNEKLVNLYAKYTRENIYPKLAEIYGEEYFENILKEIERVK